MKPPKAGRKIIKKAWGILNEDTGILWGYYGVGVSPAQVFHCRKWAEFIMKQPEHLEEFLKGRTKIISCTITYSLPNTHKRK